MTAKQKLLTAGIVGGVCGVVGVALYVWWRAREKRADDRVSMVVRQLERVADRMHSALTQARSVPVPRMDSSP